MKTSLAQNIKAKIESLPKFFDIPCVLKFFY